MEFTHHPPAANLAAPEDGRTPDFVGSLASSRRAGLGRDRPGTGGRLLDGKPEGPGGRMWGRAVVQSGNIIYRTDRQHPLQLRVYGME